MDIQTLTNFFMWMTILNGGIFTYWATVCMFAPDWVHGMQSRWFPIPRQTFDVVIYGFLGLAKVMFVFFSLVPWLALLIVG